MKPVVDRMDSDAMMDFNGKGIRDEDYLHPRVLELTSTRWILPMASAWTPSRLVKRSA
jgi:hypothetical protein